MHITSREKNVQCKLGGRKCIFFLLFICFVTSSAADNPLDIVDVLDPLGNVTITWDVMSWASDGYVAQVSIKNFQKYRRFGLPGWQLGWRWAGNEVIWSMAGGEAIMQGDCSRFHSIIPHCCLRSPQIIDLLPNASWNDQAPNCCRNGIIESYLDDPHHSTATFQMTIGLAGNSNTTVHLPQDVTLGTSSEPDQYICGPVEKSEPSLFPSTDKRRLTQALMTWTSTCIYAQLQKKRPTCCVSYSAFYNSTIIPCKTCACACPATDTNPSEVDCVNSSILQGHHSPRLDGPEMLCSRDMCPVKIHWHVKTNYKKQWRAKLTILNRMVDKNYTNWNAVVQHPNFDNLINAFSFDYKGVDSYNGTNDTAIFTGMKYYNDYLLSAGKMGHVATELLFKKDSDFTLKEGWTFPRLLYFGGDVCVLPTEYPHLPNGATRGVTLTLSNIIIIVMLVIVYLLV